MKPDIYMEIARYCDANNVSPDNIEPLVELFEELFEERAAGFEVMQRVFLPKAHLRRERPEIPLIVERVNALVLRPALLPEMRLPDETLPRTWALPEDVAAFDVQPITSDSLSAKLARSQSKLSDQDPAGLDTLTREQLVRLYQSEREWRQAFQEDAKNLLDERDHGPKGCTCSVRFGHFSNCVAVKK